jgi:hypothetical protein
MLTRTQLVFVLAFVRSVGSLDSPSAKTAEGFMPDTHTSWDWLWQQLCLGYPRRVTCEDCGDLSEHRRWSADEYVCAHCLYSQSKRKGEAVHRVDHVQNN